MSLNLRRLFPQLYQTIEFSEKIEMISNGDKRKRTWSVHTNQGALKHGRGNDNEGPDLCVMRVPPSHLVSKVQILFVSIKNGGSKWNQLNSI